MNFVPYRFRNVINPWQTPKDIHSATMFILRMMKDKSEDWDTILRANGPDRQW